MSANNTPRMYVFLMKVPIKSKNITWALVIGVSSGYILQRGQETKSKSLTVKKTPKPRKAKSYADALAISEETGRPMVLVFKMNNCNWSAKFKETLKDSRVRALLSEYVFFEISWEKHPLLCERYGVGNYPAYRLIEVIDGKENILKHGTGYKNADAFIGWIILERRDKS